MDFFGIFASIAIGFFAGLLGGIFGIGGAVFTIPLFHILLGLPGQAAVATALPLTIPTAISGAWSYMKHGLLKKRTILVCAFFGSFFSVLGAYFTGWISGSSLMLATGALFLFLAIATYLQPPVSKEEKCSLHEKAAKSAGVGAVAGFASGFFGIGGGPVLVPLLTYVRQIPVKKAIPCSLAIIGIYAIPGSLAHFFLGNLNLEVFLLAGIGAVFGAQIGSRAGIGMKEGVMKKVFSLLLFALGMILLGNELI